MCGGLVFDSRSGKNSAQSGQTAMKGHSHDPQGHHPHRA